MSPTVAAVVAFASDNCAAFGSYAGCSASDTGACAVVCASCCGSTDCACCVVVSLAGAVAFLQLYHQLLLLFHLCLLLELQLAQQVLKHSMHFPVLVEHLELIVILVVLMYLLLMFAYQLFGQYLIQLFSAQL